MRSKLKNQLNIANSKKPSPLPPIQGDRGGLGLPLLARATLLARTTLLARAIALGILDLCIVGGGDALHFLTIAVVAGDLDGS